MKKELNKNTIDAETAKKPLEIFMVEDNATDIKLAEIAFRDTAVSNNFSVVMDGYEALEFLHQRGAYTTARKPDLVLLDLNLPKISGLEVLATMMNDPKLSDIPVAIMTASESDKDIQTSTSLNAKFFVQKPVDFGRFIEMIDRMKTGGFML
ncbi:MAG: response regulator [Bacillota bacterium]